MASNSHGFTWIAITLLTLGLAGCGASHLGAAEPGATSPLARPTPLTEDPLLQDARSYAEHFDLPLEEALQQLARQDEIGNLQAQLAEAEAATFGGLWIQHEPVYAIVVAFTRNGAQTIQRYVEGTPLEGLIELRTVHYSLQELEALRQQAVQVAAQLGVHVNTGLSIQNNQAELYIGNADSLADELAQAGLQFPAGVVVVEIGGPAATNHPYLEEHHTPADKLIYFPKQARTAMSMAALLKGTLVEEEGCLRVHYNYGGAADSSILVIWDNDHALHIDEQGVAVANSEGEILGRVGAPISIGGGQVYPEHLDADLQQVIPDACRADLYWFAGK